MTKCIECGEKANDKLMHPEWVADGICDACHPGQWDEWLVDKISDYIDAVSDKGEYYDKVRHVL